ncbi:MAG TPA: hypothetical protein VFP14_11995, partial [Novosphingobium sp.]|nr:hypothetical protein [Novosphingobium sp.]
MNGPRVNSKTRPLRAAAGAAVAAFLLSTSAPAISQTPANAGADAEARLRKVEAEVRALQRQVFPGGDGKYFAPQVAAPTTPANVPGAPATTPVSDLLTRMDSVEAQLARLTAQGEETANRVAQIEAKQAAAAAAAAPSPAPATDPAAVVAPAPSAAPVATAVAAPVAAVAVASVANPFPAKPAAASAKQVAASPKPTAGPVKPSPQRLAAVQKI